MSRSSLKTLSTAASVVLGLGGVVCLGIVGLALTRVHAAVTLDQVITFYVMPTLMSVALFSATRFRAERKLSILLTLAALVFGAIAAEVVLSTVAAGAAPSRPGDGPSIAEAVTAARTAGQDLYPTIPGNILVNENASLSTEGGGIHPLAPAPGNSQAALCDELDEPLVYQSDRYGFNNHDEAWSDVEVVLVGDSYTHGVCVPPAEQLARVIGRSRRVLNLGARGAGPLQELGIVREFASPLEPEHVVWIYYEGNDRYDLAREQERQWLTDYLDRAHFQHLMEEPDLVATLYSAWIDDLLERGPLGGRATPSRWSHLRNTPRFAALRSALGFGVLVPSRQSPIGILPDVLQRAVDDVRGWGGQLTLVYMPSYARYTSVIGEGVPGKRHVLDAANELGIVVIDMDEAFRAEGSPRSFWAHPRGHLTADGYRLTAMEILETISDPVVP